MGDDNLKKAYRVTALRTYRIASGLSQKELGNKLGLSQASIGNYERMDENKLGDTLSYNDLIKIAKVLGCKPKELITRINWEEKYNEE